MQVNMFGIVTCLAEFIGGGVKPHWNIEVFKLLPDQDGGYAWVVTLAQVIFVLATGYYCVNLGAILKKVRLCISEKVLPRSNAGLTRRTS